MGGIRTTVKVIGTILKVGWRAIRATVIGTYIALSALILAYLIIKYAFGSGEKVRTQNKNLRMIKNTRKSMIKSVKAITK